MPNQLSHLCNNSNESHSHLFFACPYSRRLWERLKPIAKLDRISNDWPYIISGIVNFPAKNSVWSVIQTLTLGAAVYYNWQERNVRRMQFVERNNECLYKIVVETVRLKLMGLFMKLTDEVIKAAKIWNLPIDKSAYYSKFVDEFE